MSNQDTNGKSTGTPVSVIGKSLIHKSVADNRTRFTTLYQGVKRNGQQADLDSNDVEMLALSHPRFDDRQKRLDLITNQLLGVKLKIDEKPSHLCDISRSGFSYARRIAGRPNDYYHNKKLVEVTANNLIGKEVKASFQSNTASGENNLNLSGTVRNLELICGLTAKEADLEFKKHLYHKMIHRNNDRTSSYQKSENLMKTIDEQIFQNSWNDSLAVSANTTFLNMMKEVGVSADTVDKIFDAYRKKPMFVKIGVSVDDPSQAQELEAFINDVRDSFKPAKSKETDETDSDAAETSSDYKKRKPPTVSIEGIAIDETLSYQRFLLAVWQNCIKHYELPSATRIPKSRNHKLAEHLKREARAFEKVIESLADKKNRKINLIAAEVLIAECLTNILERKGITTPKELDCTIHLITRLTFDKCVDKLVSGKET